MTIYHIFMKDQRKIQLNIQLKIYKKKDEKKNLNDKGKIVKKFTKLLFFFF